MENGKYNWTTASNEENRNNFSVSSGNENLPKFSDTFLSTDGSGGSCSKSSFSSSSNSNSWGASTSGKLYETTTNVVLEKRFDWDGLVDKVFKDEKGKTFNSAAKN
eukprot:GFUD01011912.1.p2 GENE.GFUD01011912.1~~GFUD01011912.1.p2  ORF type:complete len:106 (-),score=23.47 GFUD01011912.1:44-361(-)